MPSATSPSNSTRAAGPIKSSRPFIITIAFMQETLVYDYFLRGSVPTAWLTTLMQSVCAAELRAYLAAQAHQLESEHGVHCVALATDPTSPLLSYGPDDLSAGLNVPISTAKTTNSIYFDQRTPVALRFCLALIRAQSPSWNQPTAALDAGLTLVSQAVSRDVSREAVAYLEADVIGGALLHSYGMQPINPRTFTLDVLTLSYADALVLEAERHAEKPKT